MASIKQQDNDLSITIHIINSMQELSCSPDKVHIRILSLLVWV